MKTPKSLNGSDAQIAVLEKIEQHLAELVKISKKQLVAQRDAGVGKQQLK